MLGNDVLVARLQKSLTPELQYELTNLLEEISIADELCKAYTHLNRDVVKISMLLVMLQRKGMIHSGIDGLLEHLEDLSMEDKVEICRVITQAQTEYATGEAKIIQYFCH